VLEQASAREQAGEDQEQASVLEQASCRRKADPEY